MKQLLLPLLMVACLVELAYSQKDTVVVAGRIESGQDGTLNEVVDAVRDTGSINNILFKLNPNESYVLTGTIFVENDEILEIAAPKPGASQETAPPQLAWADSVDFSNTLGKYLILSAGELVLKNIWIRYADTEGNQVRTSIGITDNPDSEKQEKATFDGVIFDYAEMGADAGGSITVKADHFTGIFKNCYFRNNIDRHFRYYGRAVSFPYESRGFHYDSLLFENCTFANISRIVMEEGNEYGDNIHLNHCTILNTLEWVIQPGWTHNLSITNSIIVNPFFWGYRAIDVCNNNQDYDDFLAGECEGPSGALFNVHPVESFGFEVNFTDTDRQIFIGNNSYVHQDWLLDYYTNCVWCHNGNEEELLNPYPYTNKRTIAFMDSMDGEGNKIFKTMNIDSTTMYLGIDPRFIQSAINQDTLLWILSSRYYGGDDIDWSYQPNAGKCRNWPLPEDLSYTNDTLLTAAMGGFPLGDLNWFPGQLSSWKMQREDEWTTINNWLSYGSPSGTGIERKISNKIPNDHTLKQNYPNPFNLLTQINFELLSSEEIYLRIYNVSGQLVRTLIHRKMQAGAHSIKWDCLDDQGILVPSGIYFCRIEASTFMKTIKISLLK